MATFFLLLVILAISNCSAGSIKIGGTCNANGDCEGSNIACSADKKCKCDLGYHGADGATCAQTPANTVGGACTGSTCTGQNVECPTGGSKFCTCKDGFTANPGDNGCDTVMANRIGGSCTASSCGANADCSSNVCVCKQGFTANKGDVTCISSKSDNKDGNPCTTSDCGAATKGGASHPVSSLVNIGFIISLLLNISTP